MTRSILLICALATLAACSQTSDQILYQSVGYNCHKADGEVRDWVCSNNGDAVAQVSRYCYATLGDTNCFDRPDPDRTNQPQGSTGY